MIHGFEFWLTESLESLGGLKIQTLTSENNGKDIATLPKAGKTYINHHEFHLGKPLSARYLRFVLVGDDRLLLLCEIDVINGEYIILKRVLSFI